MAYSYTNRKGSTYYLCQVKTKTGKMRYYFAGESKATPVDKIPAGYQVDESVNGIVSLVKVRPQVIFTQELASVETSLKKHPHGPYYRAVIKGNQIVIYESQGADFINVLFGIGWTLPEDVGRQLLERNAQYSPIMRFILDDKDGRTFHPERWCFRGSIDDWIQVGVPEKIEELAKKLIPLLGTDDFFELY